ncbi:MAG TPA: hypothetical protein VFK02_29325 [Kofleriaceae bacterium]|nr:hypothetical protein [Kofleriaceae bacterium]
MLLVAMALAACGHDMSDREYCTRRQMAWEMAFPNLPQTDADRTRFVDDCVTNVARAHDNGELARSIRCMNEHLVGHGHAYEQYVAFTRCEEVDPSRER